MINLNIKFDNITIWENGSPKEGGGNSTSKFIKDIATSLPPLHSMMTDIAGVDMKSFLGGHLNVPSKEGNEIKDVSNEDKK